MSSPAPPAPPTTPTAPTAPTGVAPVRVRRRVGEILVELGLLTEDALTEAIEAQRESGRRLGELLLERGVIGPVDLLRALATQFGLDFVDLDARPVDVELAQRVPEALARRHRALPVWRDGDRVVVAMANPADVLALDDLRATVRAPVRPAMADPEQIARVIERVAANDSKVAEAIRDAVSDAAITQPRATQAAEEAAGAVDQSPIVRFVDLLLTKAVQERASDIHIEPTSEGLRIRFRVDGFLVETMSPPKALQSGILSRIKVMANLDIAERRMPQDGRITAVVAGQPIDLRVATVPTIHGEAAVLRILASGVSDAITLEEVGFLPDQLATYLKVLERPWGTILVTGPTGSGKSTTLYATLRRIADPTRNVVTVEDPVEYRLDGIKQVQVNPKAGLTFATALRSFLRADPDIILVGEIRDRETATIAAEASLTGHLVLSTLHTNNAASTPLRLLEMGVEPFLVTSSVNGVLAQRLARRLCEHCRIPRPMSPAQAAGIGIPEHLLEADGSFPAFHGRGCDHCNGQGFRGRVAIHEVLVMTETLSEMVLGRVSIESLEAAAKTEGLVTLREDGFRKVRDGWTTAEELFRVIA
jgi:type IV pilus assembly protein PilB